MALKKYVEKRDAEYPDLYTIANRKSHWIVEESYTAAKVRVLEKKWERWVQEYKDIMNDQGIHAYFELMECKSFSEIAKKVLDTEKAPEEVYKMRKDLDFAMLLYFKRKRVMHKLDEIKDQITWLTSTRYVLFDSMMLEREEREQMLTSSETVLLYEAMKGEDEE